VSGTQFLRSTGGDVIDVADGFTNIEVAPDESPRLMVEGFVCTAPPVRDQRAAIETAAPVTVEFARPAPVTPA
jgi:hypothetical protein